MLLIQNNQDRRKFPRLKLRLDISLSTNKGAQNLKATLEIDLSK